MAFEIIAERQVSFSEMSANLPDLSNEKFNSFQKRNLPNTILTNLKQKNYEKQDSRSTKLLLK